MRKLKAHLTDLFFSIEFLKYFVSGVVATLVNLAVYMLMNRWLGLDKWYYSDVPAIILSVLAAYLLNRIWVFHSKSNLLEEFFRFVGSRLAISFVFEYAGIYLINHVLNDRTEIIPGLLDLAKLVALTFVVLANRISGKLYVFRKVSGRQDPQEVDAQDLMDAAMAAIRNARAFGDNEKRDRGSALYRELGDPWRAYPAFHIAGTNGKGSISSYLTHMLCQAGHKVGWYTSPYLERFNERVRVLDGPEGLARYDRDQTEGQIPDQDLVRLLDRIGKAASQVAARGGAASTQFDLMTALAFVWFQEEACDVVVLETGMGGKQDSTNVIEEPLACLIGAPGFDHMERLGTTMRQIMGEKAGIVKEGCPVFAYAPEDALLAPSDALEAREVLVERCRDLSAPLTFLGYSDFEALSYGWQGQTFRSRSDGLLYRTRMLGPYHPIYALMAGAAAMATGMADQTAVQEGIAAAIWPARMEVLSDNPVILLDGAHNEQAFLGLREALGKLAGDTPVVLVLGLLEDKEHRKMLKAILIDPPFAIQELIATEPPDPRRFEAGQLVLEAASVLEEAALAGIRLTALADIGQALDRAVESARAAGALVCICGSLYLAGKVRPLVRERLEKGDLLSPQAAVVV